VPALTAIRDASAPQNAAASAPDRTGEGLLSAAKLEFKNMSGENLEAHLRSL
jgi:hypothetical protein